MLARDVSNMAPARGRLRTEEPGARLGLERGSVAVCVPVFGAPDAVTECLRSVLRHTPALTHLLLLDDASLERPWVDLLDDLEAQGSLSLDVTVVRHPRRVGFVANCNTAFAMAGEADVVILNSDCVVADGWLEGLRDAAYCGTTVASATALSNHAGIVSVPHRNMPTTDLPPSFTVDTAARAIRRTSLRLRPRLPTTVGHCMYVRRDAIDLVGVFDLTFSPGYHEEVDWSQRCIQRGLSHVLADDVFVYHRGHASFGANEARAEQERRTRAIVDERYPAYRASIRFAGEDPCTPLSVALSRARRTLVGTSVTIDGSCLGPITTGTQVHVMGIIEALGRRDDVRVRVVVPRLQSDWARQRLSRLDSVELLWDDEVGEATLPSEVVHRPFQINRRSDVVRLRRLGIRVVLGQLDLLAFRNPAYSPDPEYWEEYREAARSVLAIADRVHFSSEFALRDAIAEGLVEPGVCAVIPPGTDRLEGDPQPEPRAPEELRGLTTGLILCLGSDYHHKNRVFALRLHRRLRSHHGWNGVLVLAGAHAPHGSSRADEAEYLLRNPELEKSVVTLGAITEGEKAWMLERAAGVLYPTVDEGFGLIPFEAAAAGVPCFFAASGALSEVLPSETATLVAWDVERSAARVAVLLDDPSARARLIDTVREAGRRFRWDDVADRLVRIYDEAADSSWRHDWRVEHVVEERVVTVFSADAPETVVTLLGRQLVGVDSGVLDDEAQQALWALTRRRWLSRPLIGGMTALHRTGHRLQKVLRRR